MWVMLLSGVETHAEVTMWRAIRVTTAALAVALTVIPAVADASVLTAASPTTRSPEWGANEEQEFVAKVNQLRASKGLATLEVNAELTNESRKWADVMKGAGKIFHSSNLAGGITSDWQKLGENVGVGGTVQSLFDAFVASPKHYENLVDPAYRFIGIGVVWDGERMFTTHRFMALFPPAAPTTAPAPTPTNPPVTAPPTTEPVAVATTTTAPPPTTAPAQRLKAPPASPERIGLTLEAMSGYFD